MIIAVIPARGGSKGVPKKNIQLLGGYPLIAYSIVIAKQVKEVEQIIVSTDSQEIADVAKHYGAEVIARPPELAKDDSPDSEWALHLLSLLEKEPEYLVHLRPTTPLREPYIIDKAIAEMQDHPEATSLRSGHPASESCFKWCIRDENEYFRNAFPDYSNERINEPRQLFPNVFIPNGYVDILKPSFIKQTGLLHGDKMLGFITPVCHEVDTIDDLEFLEFELEMRGKWEIVFSMLSTI